MKWVAVVAGLAAVGAMTGCAITSSHHAGPNGQPVHFIDGMSASAAYSKASELCPQGYTILGAPEQKSVIDYMMTVECKPSRATAALAAQPPAPAAEPKARPQFGRYTYAAENHPEVRACNPYPVPKLDAQGPGFEKYTVACADGDALSLRCEGGGCRVLK